MLFEQVSDWYSLIYEVCETCEAPELGPKVRAEFSSMRMTDCLGIAYQSKRLIRLSRPLWPYAGEIDRAEVIAHETCHIIDDYLNGTAPPHGESWKDLMCMAGFAPDCYHKVNTRLAKLDAQRRREARAVRRKKVSRPVQAKCLCQTHHISKNRAGRIRKGACYFCQRCGHQVFLLGVSLPTFS